ncbi:MFS transporter [Rubrobacter calidifluminis]|uniref:MFS transporter n=1 Tax=Rubrobacter calidifluminis TaxID=1392640 RepID=UPI00236119C4|nr:MFS transporter [Rubrobacter calidifluminis]
MSTPESKVIESRVPSRMDRLPWSRWHWMVIIALGITWILDGLEVQLVSEVGPILTEKSTLGLSTSEVGNAASIYLAGEVFGALFFGYVTDRVGRKKLFMVTLSVYLIGSFLASLSWGFWSFVFFRFIAGTGIGGEYAAINSAIDELIPARVRGWADLVINGTYWVGAAVATIIGTVLLDPNLVPHQYGWRVVFWIGAVLGIGVLLIRRHVPESPRWLMTHGRNDEAEELVGEIEEEVKRETGIEELPEPEGSIKVRQRGAIGFGPIVQTMKMYPRRSILGLSLMIAQTFLYNAIFFTYGLILSTFYHVGNVSLYLLPFAAGNFFGVIFLGRFFDTIGRKAMIAGTYATSGIMLAITGYLFTQGVLNAVTQTIAWSVIFFVATAAASSAYLTVSEIFPLETRAMAIAFFYAVGTAIGGVVAPSIFGALISSGSRESVFHGYLLAAVLMVLAAGVEVVMGVKAERQSLENIAAPLSAAEESTTRA